MSLSNVQLKSISQEVYKKFPELNGVSPEVQNRNAANAKSIPQQYLIIFKGTPAPKSIVRVVRVTADTEGKVIKISTSK
ncbi:MAG: hypothetical protein HZB52_13490 [Chloroflexi bacterium]|nr:hypothetical protein [Chloroflexota bacterium]